MQFKHTILFILGYAALASAGVASPRAEFQPQSAAICFDAMDCIMVCPTIMLFMDLINRTLNSVS